MLEWSSYSLFGSSIVMTSKYIGTVLPTQCCATAVMACWLVGRFAPLPDYLWIVSPEAGYTGDGMTLSC
jgi:hypothetical protein